MLRARGMAQYFNATIHRSLLTTLEHKNWEYYRVKKSNNYKTSRYTEFTHRGYGIIIIVLGKLSSIGAKSSMSFFPCDNLIFNGVGSL